MSDLINPQDIPEDFMGIAEELFEEGHWSNSTKVNVARFLNAAIEAGIVVRRIPDADDPRVLQRAILLMERSWLQGLGLRNTKHYIEKARKELESKEARTRELEK